MCRRVESTTDERGGDMSARDWWHLVPPEFEFTVDLTADLAGLAGAATPTPVALIPACRLHVPPAVGTFGSRLFGSG